MVQTLRKSNLLELYNAVSGKNYPESPQDYYFVKRAIKQERSCACCEQIHRSKCPDGVWCRYM